MSNDDNDDGTIEFKQPKKETVLERVLESIDYIKLMEVAYHGIVREALKVVASDPVPGKFNLAFTFDMNIEGVEAPMNVRQQYPDVITIVLNQQYNNLEVNDNSFNVTVYFGGCPVHLTIPYMSLTAFRDEFADFTIGFGEVKRNIDNRGEHGILKLVKDEPEQQSAEVISIDAFRDKD